MESSREKFEYICKHVFDVSKYEPIDQVNYGSRKGSEFKVGGDYICFTRELFDEFMEHSTTSEITFIRMSFIISETPMRFEYKEDIPIEANWDDIYDESNEFDSLYFMVLSNDLRSIFISYREGWAFIKRVSDD
jgi:hypothetical protein